MTALDPMRGAAPSRRIRGANTIGVPSRDAAFDEVFIEIGWFSMAFSLSLGRPAPNHDWFG
jgi:hypothetical protein